MLRALLITCFACAVLLVFAASILGCSGLQGYIADQCSQLRIVWMLVSLLLLLPLLLLRSRITAGLAVLVYCLNLAIVLPLYFPSSMLAAALTENARQDIVLVTINLYGARNRRYSDVVNFVREAHPELLCLNEVNKLWLQKLNADLPEYKYKFDEGISGGSAIYSRIPIEQVFPPKVSGKRRYGVRGTILIDKQPVLVVAEHPPSPSARGRWHNRNLEFARLASDAQNVKTPLVIIGDLNSTPWSPFFQRLVNQGQLIDSECGYGVQPSWSTHMAFLPPMVPIDHCLTSKHFKVMERKLGPDVGSDHLPVYVRLKLSCQKDMPVGRSS